MCTHVGNMYTHYEKSRVSAHTSVFVTHLRPLPDGEKPVSTVHSILGCLLSLYHIYQKTGDKTVLEWSLGMRLLYLVIVFQGGQHNMWVQS